MRYTIVCSFGIIHISCSVICMCMCSVQQQLACSRLWAMATVAVKRRRGMEIERIINSKLVSRYCNDNEQWPLFGFDFSFNSINKN